ncbi:MAG TPA: hypothetical protein PK156_15860 [Polyangium sp.]|nr:hypothetical protein [Polyangium sp.]
MVLRSAPSPRTLLFWFGAPIVVLGLAACPGYTTSNPIISRWFASPDCPSHEDGSLAIPIECCPCPWPDMCPDGWPEVPEHCRTGCEPGMPHECCMCPTEEWCTDEANQTYKLPDWCKDKPWLDGGADGSSAVCPTGTCVPKVPEGWLAPATLYTGFDINLETCPEGTTTWDGVADPPPVSCAPCACSTPRSICGSSPHWTVSSHSCADFESGVKWNFDPPADWDGSCIGDKALPAGKLCGADGYCAKSITIEPPVLEQIDKTCKPYVDVPKVPVPKLSDHTSIPPAGRVCIDKPSSDKLFACGIDSNCMAFPPGGPACIAREGAQVCPAGWPKRSVFYKEVNDNRSCSECSCGPVEGANCKRRYTLYTDDACAVEFGSWLNEDTDLPQCLWLIDGMAVGSKTLETVEHTLGSCQPSGGEVVGEVEKTDPFTVCCVATTE